MKVLITLLVLAVFFLALAFCVENMEQQVTVNFLKYHSDPVPVFAVALVACLTGIVFTGLVTIAEGIKLRVRNLQMSRKIRRLEAEVDALRNQALGPLPDLPEADARGENGENGEAGSERPAGA